ncbi:MAG: exodeoxyribonuclease VII large subunit, partial [Candidatus Kapaibacteriota bacterium]
MDGSLSVSQITMHIRSLLEQGIGSVIVVGEISNFKLHSSGHRYFSLKDEYA